MKNSFPGLDWLRFWLALYLVAFHTIIQYPGERSIPFVHLFYFGGFATTSFFILSGFVLTHVYLRAGANAGIKGGARNFLVRRFANIYPIHIISLLLILATSHFSIHSALEVESIVFSPDAFTPHVMGPSESVVMFALQILLLQAWYPFYLSFNYPAWSLSTLAFFYLMFPLIAAPLLRCRRTTLMLLVAFLGCLAVPFSAILFGWSGAWIEGLMHINPVVRLPEFVAGILAYKVFSSPSGTAARFVQAWRPYLFVAVLCVFFGGAYAFSYAPEYWKFFLHNGALLPAQIILIMACATGPRDKSWATHLARRLGNAALSIFVLHAIIFKVFNGIEKILGTPFSFTFCVRHLSVCMASSHKVEISLIYFPIFLGVTVGLAVVFQERVVGPIRKQIENRLLTPHHARNGLSTPVESPDSAQTSSL